MTEASALSNSAIAFIPVQVVPGQIWTFEQEQSLVGINVATTVRMTAIKLNSGGLLLYSPIAPTR